MMSGGSVDLRYLSFKIAHFFFYWLYPARTRFPDVPATADLRESIHALRKAHVRKKIRAAIHALVAGKRVKKLSHAVRVCVRACLILSNLAFVRLG